MDYLRPQLKLLLLLAAILLAGLGVREWRTDFLAAPSGWSASIGRIRRRRFGESTFRNGGEGGLGPFDDVV